MLALLTKPSRRTTPGRFVKSCRGRAVFELDVLAVGAMEVVLEVDAVGDGGHGGEAIAHGEVVEHELGDGGVGVAAGVGGVVPRAAVVGGPVQELQVRVGADALTSKKSGRLMRPMCRSRRRVGSLVASEKGVRCESPRVLVKPTTWWSW